MTPMEKEIQNVDDAKAFIQHLHDADLMFHFDDNVEDIIWVSNEPTADEMKLMSDRRDELFDSDFDWGEHDCPFGFALSLINAVINAE